MQSGGFGCAPEASRVDPSPSYLHHAPGFLSSNHGGSATSLVVRLIVSIIPSELLKAYREEQGQGDHNEDLTGNIQSEKAAHMVTQADWTCLANA